MATFTSVASGNWSDVDTWRSVSAWQASYNYAMGNFVKPLAAENGYVYEVTTDAGSSAGGEPVWPTTIGNTVVDGGITWTCRAGVPQDSDTVVVAAGHTVTVDVDMASAHTGSAAHATGINGLTITSHATTPGMLKFNSDADGTYRLQMKSATNIVGTNAATFGRLMMGGGTWGSPAAPGVGRKQIIDFLGTSAGKITGQYLAGQLKCDEPTNTYVEVYKTAYGPVSQSTAVTPDDDYIDWGTAPPAAGTAVRVQSSGTLPTGLSADYLYYVRSVSGNKCKLALQNADAQIVDITATGTGNITMYDGHTNTGTATVNVVQDVTADTLWSATDGQDYVALVDLGPTTADVQLLQLTTINAGTLVLSANVDSGQYPLARVYLCSRNVIIKSASTSTSQLIIDLASFTSSATNNWSISSGIIAVAGWGSADRYCRGVSGGTSVLGTAQVTISGGAISGCLIGFVAGAFHAMTGGVIAGCTYGIQGNYSMRLSGGTLVGGATGIYYAGTTIISGGSIIGFTTGVVPCSAIVMSGGVVAYCSDCFKSGYPVVTGGMLYCAAFAFSPGDYGLYCIVIGGTISGCGYVMYTVAGFLTSGVTLDGNSVLIAYPRRVIAYGLTHSRTSSVVSAYLSGSDYNTRNEIGITFYDYLDTPGYIARYDVGGYTVSAAYNLGTHGTPPAPYASGPPTCIHATIAQDSDVEHHVEFPLFGANGQNLRVGIYAKQPSSGVFITMPTWEIVDKANPVASEVLGTVTLTDNTNWQSLSVSSGILTADRPLFLRMRCKGGNEGGTGTVTLYWFQVLDVTVSVGIGLQHIEEGIAA